MIRVLPLLILLAITGCRTPPSGLPAAATSPEAVAAAVKPVPTTLPDVIARVNGEAISKSDFDEAVQEIEARAGEPVPADQRDRVLRGVLDELVAYRLLVQESRTRNTAINDAELEARIATIRQQFPTPEAFQQVLEQRNMSLEQLRAEVREDLVVAKLLEAQLGATTTVTPEQMTDFYAKNPDQFQQPERVRASHILISIPQGADAAAKEAARTRAAGILTDVKAGKDFAGLAKQHSQDPGSAVQGGDLGFFERGAMVGPFDAAAFSLQPAQVSDLVETTFGFHIIKVAEKQTARTIPLDEVRPQLEQYLQGQTRQQQTQAFVDMLKAKGKIEIYI